MLSIERNSPRTFLPASQPFDLVPASARPLPFLRRWDNILLRFPIQSCRASYGGSASRVPVVARREGQASRRCGAEVAEEKPAVPQLAHSPAPVRRLGNCLVEDRVPLGGVCKMVCLFLGVVGGRRDGAIRCDAWGYRTC